MPVGAKIIVYGVKRFELRGVGEELVYVPNGTLLPTLCTTFDQSFMVPFQNECTT